MLRHRAARGVILAHELRDRLAVVLDGLVEHLRVLAAHVSADKVQHRETALRAAAEAHSVRVGKSRGDHALLQRQRLDRADAVAQRGGPLEAQLLRGALHLLAQLRKQLLALSLQDQRGLSDAALIVLLCLSLEAPAGAAAHLVFQTRPFFADVAREDARAVRQLQGPADHVDDLARPVAPAEGAEIRRPVLRGRARKRHPGVFAFHVDADEGIALVVLELDVVVRLVPLDEGVLQHQRLELAVRDDHVEVAHLVHHRGHLRQMLAAEIAHDAVFQPLGFADVDNLGILVEHDVHARQLRQVIRFFQKRVKHAVFPLLSPCRYTRS